MIASALFPPNLLVSLFLGGSSQTVLHCARPTRFSQLLYTSPKGSGRGYPLLRATFLPVQPRARRDALLSHASTVSSCAFCEQEGAWPRVAQILWSFQACSFSPGGQPGRSSSARVERAPSERGRSASRRDDQAALPLPAQRPLVPIFFQQRIRLAWPPAPSSVEMNGFLAGQ
jgi:hypothetical protein